MLYEESVVPWHFIKKTALLSSFSLFINFIRPTPRWAPLVIKNKEGASLEFYKYGLKIAFYRLLLGACVCLVISSQK